MRLTLLALLLPSALAAQDLTLTQPIDCTLGETCHLQQFVDHDPGPGTRDFLCASLSYDGHQGTDFALPDLAALDRQVQVLAAAPGIVRGTRSAMTDALQTGPDAPDVSDRECGNGVVIDHGGGWETQYCHMAQNSVLVRSGDTVARGQPLGHVGLSGRTQFPHLHMTLRKDGAIVDPFAPDGATTCEARPTTLWQDPLDAPPGGLITTGFATAIPEFDAIKAGLPSLDILPPTATALVIWTFVFGGQSGDEIALSVTGPDGFRIDHTAVLTRTQAQLFRATGITTPRAGWRLGDYVGTAHHLRDGTVLDTQTVKLQITAP